MQHGWERSCSTCVSMHPGRKDHMGSAHLCMPEFSLTYWTARRRCTSRCCLETSCPFVADNTSVGDLFLSLNFLASYWKVASICLAWPVRLGIYFAHRNTRVAVTGFLLSHLIEVGTIVITQLHWPWSSRICPSSVAGWSTGAHGPYNISALFSSIPINLPKA